MQTAERVNLLGSFDLLVVHQHESAGYALDSHPNLSVSLHQVGMQLYHVDALVSLAASIILGLVDSWDNSPFLLGALDTVRCKRREINSIIRDFQDLLTQGARDLANRIQRTIPIGILDLAAVS